MQIELGKILQLRIYRQIDTSNDIFELVLFIILNVIFKNISKIIVRYPIYNINIIFKSKQLQQNPGICQILVIIFNPYYKINLSV
jgi:hypothetical protein